MTPPSPGQNATILAVELTDFSAIELRDAIRSGETSAADAARACLARIEEVDSGENGVNAFIQTFPERALEQAMKIDERVAKEGAETVGPLAGVPVAIKDNMCLAHGRTTCGSRMLENYESPFTATAVQRLIDAGAIVLGKTNLDEFAMGSSTEHSYFGPTRNPWDRSRVPGGSSGGSAAAVAARMAPLALGSDTGGSIRQPAGLTGVVGCKPTYGRVSRWGLVAFASSLDQIGPFGRTVSDVALALDVICGFDELDSTSVNTSAPACAQAVDAPINKLRVGVPKQARNEKNHPAVAEALERAIGVYQSLGAQIVDIDLPTIEYGIAAYYIIAPAEASSNLARFDGVRYGRRAEIGAHEDLISLYSRSRAEGFGEEVQRRIMLGTFALSSGYYDAYYTTALRARRLVKEDFDRVFATEGGGPGVDVVLSPSTPTPAFRIGEKADDPLAMYLEDYYTVTANLAGIAGVSVPAGLASMDDGVRAPVGVQLFSPPFSEERLMRAANMLESGLDWNDRRPPL